MDRCRLISEFVSNRIYRGVARLIATCYRRRRSIAIVLTLVIVAPTAGFIGCWYAFPFPRHKLEQPQGTVVTDRSGRTLLELAGPDDQRRRPIPLDEMSPWLIKAVIAIEDERFESHGGVDFCSVARAVGQNLWSGRTVSGASTITMQLCKMIDERPRTWRAKLIEAFRALQLEQQQTKPQILADYLNMVPCGGNLRGVEAASQAYFHKSASQLSLAEAALLAGLPQSPNRYAPDRHPDLAQRRRDLVLRRMRDLDWISSIQCDDALREPVAVYSRTLPPPLATHAAWMVMSESPRTGEHRTTIDFDLQCDVEAAVREHVAGLPEAADAAVVVLDCQSCEVLALVGSANEQDPIDGQVNGATARRSPGSTLKPFLYACAFEARRLSPESLVDDIPIERAGWSPENFDRTYRGSVTTAEALRLSLNVPAITITEAMGLPRCLGTLESVGLRLPPDAEARGGLAVATGGLEVSLLDLTNAYATLAREGIHRPTMLLQKDAVVSSTRVLEANACRAITSILSSEHRCPRGWESLPELHHPWFAWKTGTSSGRRDAWAIGHNGRFAIGVWVGFFNGAGHQEFVGREAAEPLLARLFSSTQLRNEEPDPSYEPWQVDRPLQRPTEATASLAILSPRPDAAFVALNGTTIIHPSTTSREPLTWFHNGRVLTRDEAMRLVVPPGCHELRAVASSGQAASVRFTVK